MAPDLVPQQPDGHIRAEIVLKRAYHVQGGPAQDAHHSGSMAPTPVVGAAHALAVDGHDLARGQLEGLLHPIPEALLEPARIQPREDPPQRVVRGDAVRQFQEGAQPRLVELAEEGNGHEAVGAADHGQHRQHRDVRQGMQLGPVHPGIPGASSILTRDAGIGRSMRGTSQAESGTALG